MADFKAAKTVAALPAVLEPDTIYLVRKGEGFDLWATNGVGTIKAFPLNQEGGGGGGGGGDVGEWEDLTPYLINNSFLGAGSFVRGRTINGDYQIQGSLIANGGNSLTPSYALAIPARLASSLDYVGSHISSRVPHTLVFSTSTNFLFAALDMYRGTLAISSRASAAAPVNFNLVVPYALDETVQHRQLMATLGSAYVGSNLWYGLFNVDGVGPGQMGAVDDPDLAWYGMAGVRDWKLRTLRWLPSINNLQVAGNGNPVWPVNTPYKVWLGDLTIVANTSLTITPAQTALLTSEYNKGIPLRLKVFAPNHSYQSMPFGVYEGNI